MKILMFGWEFPPFNSGGLGVACFGLTKALSQLGAEVLFVLPKKVDVSSDFAKIIFAEVPNTKVRVVDSLLKPYLTTETYIKEFEGTVRKIYSSSLLEEVKRYGELARDIAVNEEFDVIHAHDWLSFLAGIEAKRVSGRPLIVHVHATEFDRSGENINQAVYEIEKQGMEAADRVITVSRYTKDLVVQRYGINPDKVEVVYNGIDLQEYQSEDKSSLLNDLKEKGFKIVLFVGRITFQKGPDYFVKAAQKVLQLRPNVIFIITGSGDMERQIVHQAASLGISDKVLFTGFLRGEQLNTIYKSADLYVFPSVSEPFGIAPLESIANGTPVIISKQTGVSEVLSHALKVDFWDIDEMANKIIAVLDHQPLHKELKNNARTQIKEINWEKSAVACLSIYNDLCQKLLS